MIDLIREHKPVRRYKKSLGADPSSSGGVPILSAIPAIGNLVNGIINLLKTTGKRGREEFFKARNQVTEQIARAYQAQLGYSYEAMMHYWYGENQQRNFPTGPNAANEKKVIDRWFAELNKLDIGNDGEGDILSVQSISFKSFDPAFERLRTAFENYQATYWSPTAEPMQTKQQAEQQAAQKLATTSSGGTSTLMAKWDTMPADRKTVIIGTVATGALFLLIAGLKTAKVI